MNEKKLYQDSFYTMTEKHIYQERFYTMNEKRLGQDRFYSMNEKTPGLKSLFAPWLQNILVKITLILWMKYTCTNLVGVLGIV